MTNPASAPPVSGVARSQKLLEQVHEILRLHHCAIRTEEGCVNWIKWFVLFHGKRHPREMGASIDF